RVGLLLSGLDVLALLLLRGLIEQPLGLLQLVERVLRLRTGVLRAIGRRFLHVVGRLLQPLRRFREVGALLALLLEIALQLLELARGFLHFVRHRALRRPRAAGALLLLAGRALLLLLLLQLAAREVTQLLGNLVDLLIRALLLLLRVLLELILVRVA